MAAVSRATTRSFVIGVTGILVVGGIIGVGISASSGLPGKTTTTVKAAFSDVGAALQVGNDVKQNGSRIGRVSDLKYVNGQGVVTLELDGHVDVHSDARAAIFDQSALAKKFVELDVGSAGGAPLGHRIISSKRTVNSADLDQLLNVFDGRTRAALTSTVRQLGDGTTGHSQDLHDLLEHAPAILDDLGTTSAALSKPETDLPALLKSADQLAGALNGHEEQLSGLVKELGVTARAVSVDEGRPLQATLKQLPGTLSSARTSFDALDKPLDNVRATLKTVVPGARALGKATPDLRGVLREGRAPLNRVPWVSKTAQPAVEDLTKTVAYARPLAPALSTGLRDVALPLSVLARYSNEVVTFFQRVESMVSTQVSPEVHGARVGVGVEGLTTAAGSLLKDPLQGQDVYPAPGQADHERSQSPLNPLSGGN
ncbi:MlaD family protein [Streptomyces lydicus]|uniref:MlaD family protein n=1 Tax=Streptomyces lydicus TaxID=47763 RepID=UPI00341EFB2A